jgi:hypothetical protein
MGTQIYHLTPFQSFCFGKGGVYIKRMGLLNVQVFGVDGKS